MSDQIDVTPDGQIVPYAPDKPTLEMAASEPQYQEELRGPQSAAQAYEVQPLVLDTPAQPLNIIGTTQAELSGGAVLIDGAGAQFEAHVVALQAVSVSKRTPDGLIVGDWVLQTPGVVLSGPVSLSAAGNDLIVFVTGHQNVGTKPRENYRLIQRIAGQYTAWPLHPGQGVGAYTEAAPAAPAGDGLTLADLITKTAGDGTAESHDWRQALGLLVRAQIDPGLRGPMDGWVRDRAFEAATEALRKAGLPPK